MRILIVEDAAEIIDVLKEFIITDDMIVTIAMDFKEAKFSLESGTFDIVLTDWNFPYGDGDQVAELARAKGCKKIILHSGSVIYKKELYDKIVEKSDIRSLIKALAA